MTSEQTTLLTEFQALYGCDPRLFRAPGRVNLIGEHTDYNGGFVLPMAIEYETIAVVAERADRKIFVRSINLEESGEIDLDAPAEKRRGSWLDYVEGVARILEREFAPLRGANLLISSNVPSGAGLSSSAALEMSVGLALAETSGLTVDKVRLALAGQSAEHEFVGANVGIMDQFISALGEKGHALLIDCRSLQAEQIPLANEEAAIVICDSRVKHKLASSEYNTRREECEAGVKLLKSFLPEIEQLRDVSVEAFEKYAAHLPDIIAKRCRHVVTENARTLQAAEALKRNDYAEFGRLMRLSHASLSTDYEVSCKELDWLVAIADSCAGVYGARMTGGGFGGSTVNLVQRENLYDFTEKISSEYERLANRKPSIYVSNAAPGASEMIFSR